MQIDGFVVWSLVIIVVMMVVLAARFVHEVREMRRHGGDESYDREEEELEK